MALLPKELARPKERGGIFELPAHHVAPLVDLQRKVAVTADPFGEEWIHDCFAGWTDSNRFC